MKNRINIEYYEYWDCITNPYVCISSQAFSSLFTRNLQRPLGGYKQDFAGLISDHTKSAGLRTGVQCCEVQAGCGLHSTDLILPIFVIATAAVDGGR